MFNLLNQITLIVILFLLCCCYLNAYLHSYLFLNFLILSFACLLNQVGRVSPTSFMRNPLMIMFNDNLVKN